MFQSSSTDHSGCNGRKSAHLSIVLCFNPHPLITVDATAALIVAAFAALTFQSSSTDHSGCNLTAGTFTVVDPCFNPHPLITVDATES